jgi:hypothetical protein
MLECLRNAKLTSFPPASRVQLCPAAPPSPPPHTHTLLPFLLPACALPHPHHLSGRGACSLHRPDPLSRCTASSHGLVATHSPCAFLHSCLCCIHRLGPAPTHLHAALSCASTLALTCCAAVLLFGPLSLAVAVLPTQAMDRAHRLGQTRPVTVYRLITAGTIEERIQSTAAAKTHVQRQVMAEEQQGAAAAADGAAAEGGGGSQGVEGTPEEGEEGALVPGSVPDGMLLDELEEEENAAAAALGGDGAAAAAAGGGGRGLFVDDVASALGAADVASLLLDDDLAEEAARQGLSLKDLASPQKPSSRPDGGGAGAVNGGGPMDAPQQQQGLGVRFLGAHNPAAAEPAAGEGGGSPAAAAAVGFIGSAAALPPLPPAAAAAGGTPAMSFKRRGIGRPPGVGRGGGGPGSRGGRIGRPPGGGRRGRPPGSGRGRGRRGGGGGDGGMDMGGEGW